MLNKNRGQNIVEFALVVPVLVVVLVAISELGYSFVVKQTIISAIKQAVQSSHIRAGNSNVLAGIKSDLVSYINTHNLPPATSLSLKLGNSNAYGTAVLITYTYSPSYRLLNIIPNSITINSVQVVQTGLIKTNAPSIPSTPSLPVFSIPIAPPVPSLPVSAAPVI